MTNDSHQEPGVCPAVSSGVLFALFCFVDMRIFLLEIPGVDFCPLTLRTASGCKHEKERTSSVLIGTFCKHEGGVLKAMSF